MGHGPAREKLDRCLLAGIVLTTWLENQARPPLFKNLWISEPYWLEGFLLPLDKLGPHRG